MNVGRGSLALGILILVAVMLPAQEQETKELSVTIVCSAWGKPVPRQPASKEGPQPYRLDGHAVRWHIGLKRLDSTPALGKELQRLRRDRSQWVSDANKPGTFRPIPVRIDAGARVCVGDVVRTYDALMDSGFVHLRVLRSKTQFLWLPVGVPREPGFELEPLPPACLYAHPYEPDPKRWAVTIEVLQDGRVRSGDEILYDPNRQGSDFTRLRAQFTQWKQEARRLRLTSSVELDGHERMLADVPILIRADEWTPWRHVRRLMEVVMEPDLLFWINYLAVAEKGVAEKGVAGKGVTGKGVAGKEPKKQLPESRPSKKR